MKTVKRAQMVFCLISFFCGGINLQAQTGFQQQTVQERVKSAVNKISDSLSLSPGQKHETEVAYFDFYTQVDNLRKASRGATRPEKPLIERFASDRDQKLKTIFTQEQYIKFKETVEPSLRQPRSGTPINN